MYVRRFHLTPPIELCASPRITPLLCRGCVVCFVRPWLQPVRLSVHPRFTATSAPVCMRCFVCFICHFASCLSHPCLCNTRRLRAHAAPVAGAIGGLLVCGCVPVCRCNNNAQAVFTCLGCAFTRNAPILRGLFEKWRQNTSKPLAPVRWTFSCHSRGSQLLQHQLPVETYHLHAGSSRFVPQNALERARKADEVSWESTSDAPHRHVHPRHTQTSKRLNHAESAEEGGGPPPQTARYPQ